MFFAGWALFFSKKSTPARRGLLKANTYKQKHTPRATYCSVFWVLQCVAVSLGCALQCVAVSCSELQRVAVCCSVLRSKHTSRAMCEDVSSCYITLQHTATHCNTLQHTATHYKTMQHTACDTLRHTATHYKTMQHTAPHRHTPGATCEGVSSVLVADSSCRSFCVMPTLSLALAYLSPVYYSVLQRVTVRCSVLQCVAVCCSVRQIHHVGYSVGCRHYLWP